MSAFQVREIWFFFSWNKARSIMNFYSWDRNWSFHQWKKSKNKLSKGESNWTLCDLTENYFLSILWNGQQLATMKDVLHHLLLRDRSGQNNVQFSVNLILYSIIICVPLHPRLATKKTLFYSYQILVYPN